MKTSHKLALLVAALACTVPARATLFTFDGVASGTAANDLSQAGITFQPGVFLPDTDSFGSDIPGTEKWHVDGTAPAVTVDDPNGFGRGNAPSPANALNALFQPVLVLFPAATDVTAFTAKLDNDTFGDSGLSVNFYDAADNLLASIPIDQTVAGFTFTSGTLNGLSKVVLPGGAFYDNVGFTAVPEVDARVLTAGILLAGAALVRRLRA